MSRDTGAGARKQAHPRNADATRTMLLAAAKRLLLDHAAETVSTRQIAASAGVNQGLIYRYFGSKAALLDEAAATHIPLSLLRGVALADLPRILLDQTLRPATEDGESAHPPALAAFLAATHYPAVRQAVREGLIRNFTTEVANRLGGPQPQLRAELLAALLSGVALLREHIGTPALSSVDQQTLTTYVDALGKQLLDPEPGRAAKDSPDHDLTAT